MNVHQTAPKEFVDRIPPADDLLVQRRDAEHARADDHAQKQGGFDHLGAALVARQTCTLREVFHHWRENREDSLRILVTLNFASWNQLDEWLRQLDGMRLA